MAVAARAELARAPLVSVIMPTRNRAAILSRALESVREQTYPNWKLVVVDDGGNDDTAAVVERLGDERTSATGNCWRGRPPPRIRSRSPRSPATTHRDRRSAVAQAPDPAELEAVGRACEIPGGGQRPRLGPPR
jgi:cellulose synthase/poly-beta-1,6-N-acetylglucosamine synthase-like glycosyltransferase